MNTIISSDMYWVFLILRIFLRLFKMKQGSKWRTFCCAFILYIGLLAVHLDWLLTLKLCHWWESWKVFLKWDLPWMIWSLPLSLMIIQFIIISRLWVWCAFTHWILKKVLIKVLWKDCFLFEEVITHFIMALSNSVCSSLALSQTHSM